MTSQTDRMTPEDVHRFVEEFLKEKNVQRSAATKLFVATDEISTNILQYSGAKTMDVTCNALADRIEISFADDGIPYNPLEREDPDITLSAEERSIGGLGIFMVKKIMDNVEYENRDGRNILTVTKSIKAN